MAKLGEAYVTINADWSKFESQVDRGLKRVTEKFEKALSKDLGKKIGTQLGAGVREGVDSTSAGIKKSVDGVLDVPGGARSSGRRRGRDFGRGVGDGLKELGPVRRGLASLVTALEDGFSALPTEIKAVIGGALITALFPAGALLAGAVAAGLIAGVAGLGTILAFQLEEVQNRGVSFLEKLRERFVNNAAVFITPLEQAFDILDYRIALLDPTIRSLFDKASDYIVPLTDSVVGLVDGALRGLARGFQQSDVAGITENLVTGFTDLGEAAGELLEGVLSNPNTAESIGDLLDILVGLTETVDGLLQAFLYAWPTIRTILTDVGNLAQATFDTLNLLWSAATLGVADTGQAFDDFGSSWITFVDEFTGGSEKIIRASELVADQELIKTKILRGNIVLTEDQAKAVKELAKQQKAQLDLVNDEISTNLAYHRALMETNKTLKEKGAELDFNTEKGQDNIENIQNQINALKAYTNNQLATGKMTETQAQKFYNNEIGRLEAEFKKRGGNIKQFEEIFGWLIKLQNFPELPEKFGPWRISLQNAQTVLAAVLQAATTLANLPAPRVTRPGGSQGGPQAYADGGMITRPTLAMMGENFRPELVLPLTQPGRSAQLLANSPLAGMLGAPPVVNVYLGSERLEESMYRVARNVSNTTARTLSQVPRSI